MYYICGYLNRKYAKKKKCCEHCVATISSAFGDLPSDFTAQHLVLNKTKGGLKFASTTLYSLILIIENSFLEFCRQGKVFKPHSFIKILYSLTWDKLPQVGCSKHHTTYMSNLIYDYLIIRFKCVTKRKRIELCTRSKTKAHDKAKEGKLQ